MFWYDIFAHKWGGGGGGEGEGVQKRGVTSRNWRGESGSLK